MKTTTRSPYFLLSIALLASSFVVRAATPEPDAGSKLDKRLAPVAAAAEQHLDAPLRDAALARETRSALSPFEPHWNSAGQVQVYIHYDPANAAPDKEQLAALGVTDIVDRPEMGVMQAWVPAGQLTATSGLPGVLRVSLPRYAIHKQAPTRGPVTYTGSIDTQGDTILRASAFRSATGDTGQGMTVGVISDGDKNIASSQKTGDLPANIWDDPNDVGSFKSSGDEGTAMMEIVYDLAPGVHQLGFCGPETSADYLTCLGDFKTGISPNIIVDDLGFPGGAMFTTDTFTSGVESFAKANPSIHLVTAAGNDGGAFWQGTWTPTAVTNTVNGVSYTQAMDFGGGNPDLQITVNANDTIAYIVEWDDAWSDTATANDPNDFDVAVFTAPNGGGTAVACNQGINIGPATGGTKCNQSNTASKTTPGPQPVQGSQWTSSLSTYYLEIYGVHGTLTNKRLKVLIFDQSAFPVQVSPSSDGSVYGHAALAEPLETSVGAVFSGDLSLESYSSTGPVEQGTGASPSFVAKPDFVAPDCVRVTGAGGFEDPFCGTSAAAPHIAGLMALLISGYPGQSPYTLLKKSATNLGAAGQFGNGLPNMQTLLSDGDLPVPAVTISAPADNASVAMNQAVQFTGTCKSAHSGTPSYEWSFSANSGLAAKSGQSVSATFKSAGTFTATLACTVGGAVGKGTVTVKVAAPASGGGGGDFYLVSLLLLGLITLRRRG